VEVDWAASAPRADGMDRPGAWPRPLRAPAPDLEAAWGPVEPPRPVPGTSYRSLRIRLESQGTLRAAGDSRFRFVSTRARIFRGRRSSDGFLVGANRKAALVATFR
jgi:hypothetical protein